MADPRATLAALEAPFQAVDHANTDLMAARFTGDPAKIAAAEAAVTAALDAWDASGVTLAQIDAAAQAVLDAEASK